MLVSAVLLAGCRAAMVQPQAPTATPSPSALTTPITTLTLSPTTSPTVTPSPSPKVSSTAALSPTLQPPSGQALALPYTPTSDRTTGRVRGRLFFPSEFIPSLAVYAVATDGSRFYRVDTRPVPPGEPSYEIRLVEPGTYYVYAYPAGDEAQFAGVYSYLAACEAGHLSPLSEGCWENPQHDLAPVEVQAGQAVEEVNAFDWYGPSPPPPPDDTSGWPTYTNEQSAYHIRYPPHWEVRSEQHSETTFGRPDVQEDFFASVRVTTGDPEELADQLIASLPPGEVVSREWLPFAGRNSLYLALRLPGGQFAWWFVPRHELVYIVHAVTDSGLGSFEQMVESFAFIE
jgi:hypothetical protein